ncbi:MAG: hypothetical protein HRU21_08875, partial [Pseudomonadales bacterium]|nr:hypothetical protein [Pseudomonadales bacterium]
MVDSNPQAPLQSITYRHTLNSSQDDAAQFGHLLADQGYDMHQTQLSSRDFKSALLDSKVCDLDSFLYASEAFLSQNCRLFEQALSEQQSLLMQAAKQTDDISSKEQLIDAIDICQRDAPAIISHFIARFCHQLQQLLGSATPAKASLESETSPSMLAKQSLIANCHRYYGEQLSDQSRLLQQILPKLEISQANNPFAPALLVDAACQSLLAQSFSEESLANIINSLDYFWFAKLKSVYQSFSDMLREPQYAQHNDVVGNNSV